VGTRKAHKKHKHPFARIIKAGSRTKSGAVTQWLLPFKES